MKHFIYLLLIFSLLYVEAKSQGTGTNPNNAVQENVWVMYFGNHTIAEHWKLHTEYQWRRSEYFQNWQQSLLRLGVDYLISPALSATLGYGWINTYPYGEQPIVGETGEHRLWQQIILNNRIGRLHVQHRYRLEQRWVDRWLANSDGSIYSDGYNYSNRLRYRIMLNFPLNQPTITKGAAFLSIYDEPFISFGIAIKRNHFDQNRFYAAVGYQYSESGNIQLGYLNQLLIKPDGFRREINHTLQIGITQHLDLRPKT